MMQRRYQNTGAPFQREDGTVWAKGMVGVPTEGELRQRRYKMTLVDEPVVLHVEDPGATAPKEEDQVHDGAWPLEMDPQKYLVLNPDGRFAPLARRMLAAKEESAGGTAHE